MGELVELVQNALDPELIIQWGGLAIILIMVFAETGLFFGFFFPGDSLLFSAGLFCAIDILEVSISLLVITIILAGILGNYVGYYFGYRLGLRLFQKKDTFFFKQKHMHMAKSFYERHGGKALIIARFLPIIRTFAPIMAGVVHLDWKKFSLFNIVGCIIWVVSLTLTGYYLGLNFPNVKNYLPYIILGLIVITIIPVIMAYVKEHRKYQKDLEG